MYILDIGKYLSGIEWTLLRVLNYVLKKSEGQGGMKLDYYLVVKRLCCLMS